MNGLGLVYFYIDVIKDEIEKKEESLGQSAFDTINGWKGGELSQMRTALSRFEQVATQLQGDLTEKLEQDCINKLRAASHGKKGEIKEWDTR